MADPIDVHVGKHIRARRKRMGLSQQALAEALGVTFQQVQKYERGTNRVSSSMLWRAAVCLKTPIAEFYPPQDAASTVAGLGAAQELASIDGGYEVAEGFKALNPTLRRAVRNIVGSLLETMGEEPGATYVTGGDPEARRVAHAA